MNRQLSVIIPTFNNRAVLERCLDHWRENAGDKSVEILVIEDGCQDDTREYLEKVSTTEWGKRFLRWFHEDDVNELRCNNRGFAESAAPLALVWQDDMFLQGGWMIDEIVR